MEVLPGQDGIGRISGLGSSRGVGSRFGRGVIWTVSGRGALVVVKRVTRRYVLNKQEEIR